MIPTGAAAMRAWKRLDRETRRELLRSRHAHADPAVAAVAVGYARTRLGARGYLSAFLVLVLVFVLLIVMAVLVGLLGPVEYLPDLGSVVAALVMLVAVGWFLRLRFALTRMENANAPVLVPASRPAIHESSSGEVVVTYDAPALIRLFGTLTLVLAGCAGVGYLLDIAFIYWLTGLSAISMVVILVVTLSAKAPAAVFDARGLHLPKLGFDVAWSEITELRIMPQRGLGAKHKLVAFMIAEPEPVLARMRPRTARRLRTAVRFYGTPLVLPEQAMTHTAQEMARAAEAYGNLPVRDLTD